MPSVESLPKHWKDFVRAQGTFTAHDFDSDEVVEIEWEDGSRAIFKNAFAVYDQDRCEVAVFTEHCGYYVFITIGLHWHYYRKKPAKYDA